MGHLATESLVTTLHYIVKHTHSNMFEVQIIYVGVQIFQMNFPLCKKSHMINHMTDGLTDTRVT